MPVFEYEVADRRGALSRGRREAETQGDLIAHFKEQGQLVLAARAPAAAGRTGGVGAVSIGTVAGCGR
ncbi:MAG: hypothetical protein AAB265_03450, partial [candidate division NC10 bacterium]